MRRAIPTDSVASKLTLGVGYIALLWGIGLYMRLVILIIPPLIPHLIQTMGLSATEVSVLVTLPVLVLGLGITAFGKVLTYVQPKKLMLLGLSVMSVGSVVRAIPLDYFGLLAATAVVGIGIAAMQSGLPIFIRSHFPHSIGRATAIYTNALLFGEVVGASFTLPMIHSIGENHWRLVFLIWTAPCILVMACLAAAKDKTPIGIGRDQDQSKTRCEQLDTRKSLIGIAPRILRYGLLLGGTGTIYFSANTFIPLFLHAAGQDKHLNSALMALNGCQLISSLGLVLLGEKAHQHRYYFTLFAVLALVGLCTLWVVSPGINYVYISGLIGFSTAGMLTIGLTLPTKDTTGHSTVGQYMVTGSIGLGYLIVFAVSTVAGAIVDWRHALMLGTAPAAALAVLLVILSTIPYPA